MALIVVPVAAFVALVAWGFSSPVGSAPDDDYHMASIWCALGDRPGLCEAGTSDDTRRVPKVLLSSSSCFAFHPEVSASCTIGLSERLVLSDRGNFDHTYPPVFYGAMGLFASPEVAASILVMRSVNAALFVGLVTALFFLLRPHRRPALLWGATVALVPLGTFLIPSVNPSSWAIISAATLWGSLVGFFDEHRRGRRIALAAFAVLATVLAAGARSDAAVYSGIAVFAACVVSFRRTRRYALSLILPGSLVVVAVVFFFASGQSSVADPGTSVAGRGSSIGSLLSTNLPLLPGLWTGALGTWGLGWLDTAMPALVWVPTIVIYAGTIVWCLRNLGRAKSVALAVVFAALVLVPLYVLVHDRVVVGSGVQPRYVYPLMILLLAVAVTGIVDADLSFNRVQLVLIVGSLAIANATALHTNIRRYVTGNDHGGAFLDAGREWWWAIPIGPTAFWAIGTVAFSVALTGLAVAAWRRSRNSDVSLGSTPITIDR